jgi:hypothetical protein
MPVIKYPVNVVVCSVSKGITTLSYSGYKNVTEPVVLPPGLIHSDLWGFK